MIAPARPAATICVFRPGAGGSRVLMVQRTRRARFMGGAWVFPGGAIDEQDREIAGMLGLDETGPGRVAAIRELAEEAGLWLTDPWPGRDDRYADLDAIVEADGVTLAADRLVYFARWITPTAIPMRFDTWFFAVEVPEGLEAAPDMTEVDAVDWVTPEEALRRADAGEWTVPFPTQMTLRQLAPHRDLASLAEAVRAAGGVAVVQPRMRFSDEGGAEVLLPGDAGFDEAGDAPPPSPEVLRKVAEASRARGEAVPEID